MPLTARPALSTSSSINITSNLSTDVVELSSTIDRIKTGGSVALANGAANEQANTAFRDIRTLTSVATENLDLAGVLVDAFGGILTFSALKLMYFKNKSATNTLVIGGAATLGFIAPFGAATDKIIIPPLGRLFLDAPLAGMLATAGSADLLRIARGTTDAGDVLYDVVLIGVGTRA